MTNETTVPDLIKRLRFCGKLHPKVGYPENGKLFNEAADALEDELRKMKSGWRDMGSAPDWEGFGRALMEDWPTGDIDGSHLFDMSLKYGLIVEVPGGYNPDEHIDAEGICPETGDPWFEYAFGAQPATEQPSVKEAARVLLGDGLCKCPITEALEPFNNDIDVWADVKAALRSLMGDK